MDQELVPDSLVYRDDPAASPDGLAGDEGTFSLCTFNYVDALARAGRLEESRLVFEKMLTYANHLGLYSEEIGLTGEQLGNFPQAFTHLALIDAAITLDAALDEAGSVRGAARRAGIPLTDRAADGGRPAHRRLGRPSNCRRPLVPLPAVDARSWCLPDVAARAVGSGQVPVRHQLDISAQIGPTGVGRAGVPE